METPNHSTIVAQNRPRFARLRRIVFGLAIFGTLLGVFYAVEDWRGRNAWEQCKREMQAGGIEVEWKKYMPGSMPPDDQNFFKVPKMVEWFVRENPIGNQVKWMVELPADHATNPVPVAEITVMPPNGAVDTNRFDGVFQMGDAGQAAQLLLEMIGPRVNGAQGYTFIARPLAQIKVARVILRAGKIPTLNELTALFPENTLAGLEYVPNTSTGLKIKASGSNTFQLVLDPPPVNAAEYLVECEKRAADFELIRQATRRPYAQMEGDYSAPVTTPVPNFVQLRTISQILSQRAKCHLLMGEPGKALDDLTLVRGLCRMLERRPSGKPLTLIGAMINVAITGLYADALVEGIRLKAWREPQLAVLEKQLREVDLMPQVAEAFREAGAAFCFELETFSAAEYSRIMKGSGGIHRGFWDYAGDPGFWQMALGPRGWRYQNMAASAQVHKKMDEEFDPGRGLIDPAKAGTAAVFVGGMNSWNPYNYFTLRYIPNYIRAGTTMAYQQTMINEAAIACALERFHAAHGQYPETLDALAPQYLEKIPVDIIGGQPLNYRRTEAGQFLLYSIGWNQKDDGGKIGRKGNGIDQGTGDWVWINSR